MRFLSSLVRPLLRRVGNSIWWCRLRHVHWYRLKQRYELWRFKRQLGRDLDLMMVRRRRAWRLMQRTDLSPEEEKNAREYHAVVEAFYQDYRDFMDAVYDRDDGERQ